MKIAALILASVAVLARAQTDGPECKCGMFLTYWHDEILVHTLPPFDIDDCKDFEQCKQRCAEEFDQLTGGGDLDFQLEGGYTVGQELCLTVLTTQDISEINYETVYGYARQCNGPWDYTGVKTFNQLCCVDGRYVHCT
ncbi:uncharacterized protein [Panulirus ornatus]|uniref:uncharacterized protein n=1 Tax=Panulirus ornatus TaxID=150431 RepID=UPI003A83D0C1